MAEAEQQDSARDESASRPVHHDKGIGITRLSGLTIARMTFLCDEDVSNVFSSGIGSTW